MSYSLQVGTEVGDQIATNSGWGEVQDYADRIYAGPRRDEFSNFLHFVTHGFDDDPVALRDQITTLLSEIRPQQETARTTLREIVDALDGATSDQVVAVVSDMKRSGPPEEQQRPT